MIFMCSVNYWHQQDSSLLFKESIGHVTSQCKWPIGSSVLFLRSKGLAMDPKLILRIQCLYSGSKVITLDSKLSLRIQSYFCGSKVITPDPKLLFRIQSYYAGSKVFTSDPIQFKISIPEFEDVISSSPFNMAGA